MAGLLATSRVWSGHTYRHGALRVECSDSLGVPVVRVSDGVEVLVVPVAQVEGLVSILRRVQNRAVLATR